MYTEATCGVGVVHVKRSVHPCLKSPRPLFEHPIYGGFDVVKFGVFLTRARPTPGVRGGFSASTIEVGTPRRRRNVKPYGQDADAQNSFAEALLTERKTLINSGAAAATHEGVQPFHRGDSS